MGLKFPNPRGNNLYKFWGDQLTDAVNAQLKKSHSEVLLNLASVEYFKALDSKSIRADIITPVFKDMKNGKYKIISFYAKKARGLMSAYIIKNQLQSVDDIKQCNLDGYHYNTAMSTAREWVFCRDQGT